MSGIQELLNELFEPEGHEHWLNASQVRYDGLTAQQMIDAGRSEEVEAHLTSLAGGPIHVYPAADLIEHDTEGDECLCGPTTEPVPRDDGSMGWLMTHHSLDGRERYEE